jgi:transcriptional regulator with XRE-family HTH domain
MSTDYGSHIRAARLARGWSRQHLAEESGVTIEQVDAIENGRGDPEPAIAALQLEVVTVLLPRITAGFIRAAGPVIDMIPPERLPLALAAVLEDLARAAAGIEEEPVQQVNLIAENP